MLEPRLNRRVGTSFVKNDNVSEFDLVDKKVSNRPFIALVRFPLAVCEILPALKVFEEVSRVYNRDARVEASVAGQLVALV